MKRLLPLFVLLFVVACGAGAGLHPKGPSHLVGGVAPSLTVDRLVVQAGTAGTMTVGTGAYVNTCRAWATATNATMTVTPCNPAASAATACTAQPAMAIPTSEAIPFAPPMDTNQGIGTVADTSTIVFANTVWWWCLLYQYSP